MDNNKYIFDIETISKKESEASKELRRKKHRQGRVLAWVVLVAGILLLGAALFFGGRAIVKSLIGRGGKTVASVDEPVDDGSGDNSVIDELIGGEDEVVVTPPEPVDEGPSEEELFEEALRNYIHTMTPEEQVLGLFIVTPEQITGVSAAIRAGDGTKKALEEYPVGGLIYSDKNMIDPDQFKTMIEGTKGYSKYPLFIAVDETLGKSVFPAKMKVAATQSASEIAAGGDASVARSEEAKIAGYLSEFGVNMNLGVVADVYPVPEGDGAVPAVSFGTDAAVVAEMVTQCVGALNEQGISAGVKFFPGQGYASADTSEAIAQNDRTREDMEACELLPFIAAADAGASVFVVSHESVPGLAGEAVYASQSKEVMTNLIRVELEMDSIIVITDDLSKTAVSAYYESGEYCVAALKAGADMLLKPEDFKAAYAEVLNAVNTGVIAKERVEDSLVRIYKVKFKGMTFDELNSLTAEKIVQP